MGQARNGGLWQGFVLYNFLCSSARFDMARYPSGVVRHGSLRYGKDT
jgi:hypothetical protein